MFQRRILLALGISGLVFLMTGILWSESEPTSAASPKSVAVSAGADHTCVITNGSLVECWGDNSYGALGDGSTTDSSTPVEACDDTATPCTQLSGAAVSSGGDFTCVLITGNAKCWGRNDLDQAGALCDNSELPAPICFPPVTVFNLSGATAITTGLFHGCGLTTGDDVKCWGNNSHRQLANGTSDQSAAFPVCVSGSSKNPPCVALDDIDSVDAGDLHTCAVTLATAVTCWGSNTHKKLGDVGVPDLYANTVVVCVTGSNEVEPETCDELTGIVDVASGGHHNCAVYAAGGVTCWGDGRSLQVGSGCTGTPCQPVDVTGFPTNVASVAAGTLHSCALTTARGVKCWGENGDGQLGDGSNVDSSTPVDVVGLTSGVAAISAQGNYTCALTDADRVTCWGSNDEGQLGDGTTTSSNVPVNVAGAKSGAYVVAAGGFGVSGNEACAIIENGRVQCWGGVRDAAPHAVCADAATPCTKLTNVAALAAGGVHNCALLNVPTVLPPDGREGKVLCWGKNTFGQLGDGTNTDSDIPLEVDLNWFQDVGTIAVVAGVAHSCAVSQWQTVKCWGFNGFGQLGDGSTTDSNVPVVVSGGHDTVMNLAAGAYHTCFRTEDDTAMCWGNNDKGQLGDDSTTNRNVPVDVCGPGETAPCNPGNMNVLDEAAELAAGMSFTCARTTTTGVLCWGKDSGGELGNGSGPESHVPDEVCADAACLTSLSGVTAIGAGWKHGCAVKAGGVKCWGWNSSGQLGDDHECGEVACTAPVDVCDTGASDPCGTNLLADISSLAAGGFVGRGYTCAVTTGNSIKCWGNNHDRQLGGPTTQQCGSLDCSTTPIDVNLGATSPGAAPPPVPLPCSGGASSGDAALMLVPMIGVAFLSAGWHRRRRKL